MPIRAECESCGKVINAKDDAAGRRIKCPECGDPISVPRGRRKKGARKKAARRRPEESSDPDFGDLDFGRLAAMERRGDSLGKGTVEECVSCGEPVGEFTEECPHCGEPHAELKQIKKRAKRKKEAAQDTVIIEDKRDFEKLARRDRRNKKGRSSADAGDEGGGMMPSVIMIGISVTTYFVWGYKFAGPLGAGAMLTALMIAVPVSLVLSVGACYGTAAITGASFGDFGEAIVKLVALLVFPDALALVIWSLMDFSIGGLAAAGLIRLGVYWGLLSAFFELQLLDKIVLVVSFIVISNVAAKLAAGA